MWNLELLGFDFRRRVFPDAKKECTNVDNVLPIEPKRFDSGSARRS